MFVGGPLSVARGFRVFPAAAGKPQKEPAPSPAPAAAGDEQDQPLPGDWGPELLYSILSSPNEEAQFGLLRATFAAGPAIIPQLTAALKDDRTAEYAAQSLAYIGGDQALPILWKLLSDPRDLNLRRLTYGALAEFDSPQATDILFDVINKSDDEPDRTVTEAAVIALTVRTDTALLPRLLAAEKKLQDVVIRDDLDNARAVIEERAKYLASPEGKKSGGSIESAVRTYFMPALEPPPAPETGATSPAKKNVERRPPRPHWQNRGRWFRSMSAASPFRPTKVAPWRGWSSKTPRRWRTMISSCKSASAIGRSPASGWDPRSKSSWRQPAGQSRNPLNEPLCRVLLPIVAAQERLRPVPRSTDSHEPRHRWNGRPH